MRDSASAIVPATFTIGGTEYTLEPVSGVANHYRSTVAVTTQPFGTGVEEISVVGTLSDGSQITSSEDFDAYSELIYALSWNPLHWLQLLRGTPDRS